MESDAEVRVRRSKAFVADSLLPDETQTNVNECACPEIEKDGCVGVQVKGSHRRRYTSRGERSENDDGHAKARTHLRRGYTPPSRCGSEYHR